MLPRSYWKLLLLGVHLEIMNKISNHHIYQPYSYHLIQLSISVSCRGQQRPAAGAGALGAADLGMAQTLLEEVAINPP